MATVYVGRPLRLPRAVAIKQLRPEFSQDRALVAMFLDEVQLLSRVRHKNVVAPIEHIEQDGEHFIVMEYVDGASLSRLCAASAEPLAPSIASRLVSDVLAGLAAAHEALDPNGQPLGIVHRDVSPHNILVGSDGAARLADFGIAKAAWRAHVTQHGELKGKPGYMAPEQLLGKAIDRRADLYAAGIVLAELLIEPVTSDVRPERASLAFAEEKVRLLTQRLDDLESPLRAVLMKALASEPEQRFRDAQSMARALMDAAPPARDDEVSAWVARSGEVELARQRRAIDELDRSVAELADAAAYERFVPERARDGATDAPSNLTLAPGKQPKTVALASVLIGGAALALLVSLLVVRALAPRLIAQSLRQSPEHSSTPPSPHPSDAVLATKLAAPSVPMNLDSTLPPSLPSSSATPALTRSQSPPRIAAPRPHGSARAPAPTPPASAPAVGKPDYDPVDDPIRR